MTRRRVFAGAERVSGTGCRNTAGNDDAQVDDQRRDVPRRVTPTQHQARDWLWFHRKPAAAAGTGRQANPFKHASPRSPAGEQRHGCESERRRHHLCLRETGTGVQPASITLAAGAEADRGQTRRDADAWPSLNAAGAAAGQRPIRRSTRAGTKVDDHVGRRGPSPTVVPQHWQHAGGASPSGHTNGQPSRFSVRRPAR